VTIKSQIRQPRSVVEENSKHTQERERINSTTSNEAAIVVFRAVTDQWCRTCPNRYDCALELPTKQITAPPSTSNEKTAHRDAQTLTLLIYTHRAIIDLNLPQISLMLGFTRTRTRTRTCTQTHARTLSGWRRCSSSR